MAAQMKPITKVDLIKLLEKYPNNDIDNIGYIMSVQDGMHNPTHQVIMLYESLTGDVC